MCLLYIYLLRVAKIPNILNFKNLNITHAAKVFTKIDLASAYNLVRVRPGDE